MYCELVLVLALSAIFLFLTWSWCLKVLVFSWSCALVSYMFQYICFLLWLPYVCFIDFLNSVTTCAFGTVVLYLCLDKNHTWLLLGKDSSLFSQNITSTLASPIKKRQPQSTSNFHWEKNSQGSVSTGKMADNTEDLLHHLGLKLLLSLCVLWRNLQRVGSHASSRPRWHHNNMTDRPRVCFPLQDRVYILRSLCFRAQIREKPRSPF